MRFSKLRVSLMVMAAAGAMAGACNASAQALAPQSYDLEAQDLGDALRAIGRISGREIIFPSDVVVGKRAPRLQGLYAPDDAIRMLLQDSGLVAEFRRDVVLIRGRSSPSGAIETRPAADADIIVTGTHIRGAESTSPVIVASRTKIEEQGLTDLGSFARSLVQNYSGGQNPGVVGTQGASEDGNGSSTLNLRGLGPDATLTLVNGHRVAYDAISQGVDISAIPLLAVDRVEIIADGSSALYGSDAVGGVANIILRRDYDGVSTSARFGAATGGGAEQQQYGLVAGKRWATGGFMAAVDYNKSTDVTADQRSLTRRLDRSATILPGQKQFAAVLAAHQQFGDAVTLEIDGQFNKRKSGYATPFLATASASNTGIVSAREVESWSITPVLRWRASDDWEFKLLGTYGRSDTFVAAQVFFGGTKFQQNDVYYNNDFKAIEGGAEGALFTIPGGEVRVAFGGGYRSVNLDSDVFIIRPTSTSKSTDYEIGRDISYGYVEVSLPLVGSANARPLLHRLSLTGAVRYEHYRGIGGPATPKLGLIYQPHPDVTIKGTWGKSFKAPTLSQQGQTRQAILVASDFFLPEPPGGLPGLLLAGGSDNLEPEKATTWTATVGVAPSFLPDLRLEISYFDVRYRNRIVVPIDSDSAVFASTAYRDLVILNPSSQQVLDAIAAVPTGLTNQTGGPFDPALVSAIVDNRLQNVARQKLRGLDISAQYGVDLSSRDKLHFDLAASYLESDQKLSAGQATIIRAGTIFDPPHWRGRGSVRWDRDNVALTTLVSHIGGTLDDRVPPFARVGAFTALDAIAEVRTADANGIFSGITIRLSVLNLLDERPDRIRTQSATSTPFDSTNYPIVGRSVGVALTKTW